ncbi:MAG: InlB B-repeat-containing protein [Clostridia bacterium]
MKKLKLICTVFIVFLMISLTVISVSALSWEGSTAGGGGGGTSATNASFALLNTDYNSVDGYRFSVVDSNGNTVSQYNAIDIFRDSTYMSTDYKFTTKYNKSQLITLQNSAFSTSKVSSYCYTQSSFSFLTDLPDPDEMDIWATWDKNIDPILNALGFANGVDDLAYGYKVLVEPIYHIKLEGTYHALTLTEIALYGKYYLGASSDGGLSYDSGTWGFISTWTNMYFANWLYTSDGMGLWTNATYLSDRATFNTLINSGYGVGIVYAVDTQEEYTVTYNANGGSGAPSSQTKYEDVTLKLSSTVPTRTGYTFVGWGTSASDTSVNYAAGANYTGNANLNLYAIWEVNTALLFLRLTAKKCTTKMNDNIVRFC